MGDPIKDSKPVVGVELIEGGSVSPSIDDAELVQIIESDINRFNGSYKELLDIAKKNEEYWKGQQIDPSKLNVGEAQVVVNRILVSVETMCAIITADTPNPWAIVTPLNRSASRKLKNKIERHLRDEWEYHQNMQQKMEKVLRNYFLNRVGLLKVTWDDELDDFDFDVVRLSELRFDLKARSFEDTPVIHFVTKCYDELFYLFPEKEEELRQKMLLNKHTERSEVTYVEYWSHYYEDGKKKSFVVFYFEGEVLDKEFNPFWNKGQNHFKHPKKPFIPLNSISLGNSLVDDTSLVENAISLQDLANKRKRQIDKAAKRSNGIYVAHSSAMDETEFDQLGETTEKVYLTGDNENWQNGFGIVTGRAFDQGVFTDLNDTFAEMDNVLGTHETTRGERGASETFRGRALLRDADYGRLDLTARSYEQVAEEVYNWMIQMMFVKYKKKHSIVTQYEDSNPLINYQRQQGLLPDSDLDEISKGDFKGHEVKIIVKKGSTRAKNPAALAEDAVMLLQTGAIDNLTFAEMYGFDNPREIAKRMTMFADPNLRTLAFPEFTGVELDPEAKNHIRLINSGDPNAYKSQTFPLPSPEEMQVIDPMQLQTLAEDFAEHINTHDMYIKGAEIDEDIDVFTDLDVHSQEDHHKHLKIETEFLKQLEQMLMAIQPDPLMGEMDPEMQEEPEAPDMSGMSEMSGAVGVGL